MAQTLLKTPHLVRQIQLHSQGDPPYPADNGECRALLSRLLLFVLRFGFLPLENEEIDDQNLFPGGEPSGEEGGGEGERRGAGGQDGESFLNYIFDAFFTIYSFLGGNYQTGRQNSFRVWAGTSIRSLSEAPRRKGSGYLQKKVKPSVVARVRNSTEIRPIG